MPSAALATGAASLTPEQFGAVGDGVADDAPAIQRALDALATHKREGVVILQPRIAYRCDTGLEMDCSYVSLWGQGLLDFSRCKGPCLRVNASSTAAPNTPANNYGHRGTIGGALRLQGGGLGKTAIGILFDSDAVATSAQLLMENCSVSRCTTGIEFARRAYNSLLVRCEVFECDTCLRWGEADDNGERNTLTGCTLFNSTTAVHLTQPSAALYLESCSIDYTVAVYVVERGMVFATDCHHESNRWSGRPFLCSGDGAVIHMTGGIIVGQADPLAADFLFEAGEGASIRLDGLFVHNVILSPPGDAIMSWATGPGDIQATRCETFDHSRLPARLHDSRTMLADPDFTAGDWQDAVWRLGDGARPIVGRYGAGDDTLILRRASFNGQGALSILKRSGAGIAASVALICLPVRPGEQVLAGFQVRRDPRHPGRAATINVAPSWVRIDGQDSGRVPVVTRLEATGVLAIDPEAGHYLPIAPMSSRSNRLVPSWATHFVMVADLTRADNAGLLVRGLWCDTI